MIFPLRRGALFLQVSKTSCCLQSIASSGFDISRKGYHLGGFANLNASRNQFDRCSRLTTLWRPKSTFASQQYAAKSTLRSDQAPNSEIDGCEKKPDLDGLGNAYFIAIDDNGKSITIATASKNIDHDVTDDNDIPNASAMTSESWKFSSTLFYIRLGHRF